MFALYLLDETEHCWETHISLATSRDKALQEFVSMVRVQQRFGVDVDSVPDEALQNWWNNIETSIEQSRLSDKEGEYPDMDFEKATIEAHCANQKIPWDGNRDLTHLKKKFWPAMTKQIEKQRSQRGNIVGWLKEFLQETPDDAKLKSTSIAEIFEEIEEMAQFWNITIESFNRKSLEQYLKKMFASNPVLTISFANLSISSPLIGDLTTVMTGKDQATTDEDHRSEDQGTFHLYEIIKPAAMNYDWFASDRFRKSMTRLRQVLSNLSYPPNMGPSPIDMAAG